MLKVRHLLRDRDHFDTPSVAEVLHIGPAEAEKLIVACEKKGYLEPRQGRSLEVWIKLK
jgi:hypothetical protein